MDVNLAVDMLSHTLNKNMDTTVLLAGDQDSVPVLEALVRAGMYVELIYAPSSISDRLMDAADDVDAMDYRDLYRACSPGFRETHKLVGEGGYENPAVENHLNRNGNATDRWQLIGSGHTVDGRMARVANVWPENHFALLVDRGDGHTLRFTHQSPALLCRQTVALGYSFTVAKIHAEFRDFFPPAIQTALTPAARPADAG